MDGYHSTRDNRNLLKNRRKFKPNQTPEYTERQHNGKVSKGIGTHYRNYKNSYVNFIFRLLFLLFNILIIIFIVIKICMICLKHL